MAKNSRQMQRGVACFRSSTEIRLAKLRVFGLLYDFIGGEDGGLPFLSLD